VKVEPVRPAGGRSLITAYGAMGFRFGAERFAGSCLLLEAAPLAWPVASVGDLNADTLASVLALSGRVEFLLLGTGSTMLPVPRAVRDLLREAAIGLEFMDTPAACRIYNTLSSEGRAFAAGFIAVP
jgi:uncharacterized protein